MLRKRLLAIGLVAALSGALAVGFTALGESGPGKQNGQNGDNGHHKGNLVFRSSLAPSQPMPTDPELNDVQPGGVPWVIDRGDVKIKRDGRIRLKVRGLVIPTLGNAGQVTSISASIACADDPPADETQTAPLSQSGDGKIKDDLNLPSTCLGPRVFVHPNGNEGVYIAISGWRF
jgi:hypothetical protein